VQRVRTSCALQGENKEVSYDKMTASFEIEKVLTVRQNGAVRGTLIRAMMARARSGMQAEINHRQGATFAAQRRCSGMTGGIDFIIIIIIISLTPIELFSS
jgi:hypothetical protein